MSQSQSILNDQNFRNSISKLIKQVFKIQTNNLEYNIGNILEVDYDSDDSDIPVKQSWNLSNSNFENSEEMNNFLSFISQKLIHESKKSINTISENVLEMVDTSSSEEDSCDDNQSFSSKNELNSMNSSDEELSDGSGLNGNSEPYQFKDSIEDNDDNIDSIDDDLDSEEYLFNR